MKWEILKGSEDDFEGYHEEVTHIYSTRRGRAVSNGVAPNLDGHLVAERRPITEPDVWLNLDECDGSEYLGPVVGKEMECHAKDGSIFAVVVVAFDGDLPIVKTRLHGNYFGCDPSQLKPIRSPEDVARDNAVNDMAQIIEYRTGCSPKPLAGWLYDAGYRKVE